MTPQQFIKSHEGLRLDSYEDTEGHLTIGWGHKVVPEDNIGPGDSITGQRAEELFTVDYERALLGVDTAVPSYNNHPYDVQAVLISMVFQMGVAGVAGFVMMNAALSADPPDYERAAAEMLDSKWARQTPRRAAESAEIVRKGGENV